MGSNLDNYKTSKFSLKEKIENLDVEQYEGNFCFKANSLKKDLEELVKEFIKRDKWLIQNLIMGEINHVEFWKRRKKLVGSSE